MRKQIKKALITIANRIDKPTTYSRSLGERGLYGPSTSTTRLDYENRLKLSKLLENPYDTTYLDSQRLLSEYLVQDDSVTRNAQRIYQTFVVGVTGLTPTPYFKNININQQKKKDIAARLTDAWFDWATNPFNCDFYGINSFTEILNMSTKREFVEGEAYFYIVRNAKEFKIQPISARNITDKYTGDRSRQDRDGIIFDKFMRPIAYRVATEDVDDYYRTNTEIKIVPIRNQNNTMVLNMLRLFEQKKQQQIRGVPQPFIVSKQSEDYKEYMKSELERARMLAKVFGVYKSASSGSYDFDSETKADKTTSDFPTTDEVRMWEAPAGSDVDFAPQQAPNSNGDLFLGRMSNDLFAAYGIPGEIGRMQFSSSYSASRAALNMMVQTITPHRERLISQVVARLWGQFVIHQYSRGKIDLPQFEQSPEHAQAWMRTIVRGSGAGSLDLSKEVKAIESLIDKGLISKQEAILRWQLGSDYSQSLEEQRAERELENEYNPQGAEEEAETETETENKGLQK